MQQETGAGVTASAAAAAAAGIAATERGGGLPVRAEFIGLGHWWGKTARLITVTNNRDRTGPDFLDLFGRNKIEGRTGMDGKMATKLVGGAGLDGTAGALFLNGERR